MPYGCIHDGFQEAMDYEFNAGFDSISEAYRATANDAWELAANEAKDESEIRSYLDFWGSEFGPYADPGTTPWSMATSMEEKATEYGPFVAAIHVVPLSTFFF